MTVVCSIPECGKPHEAKGFCTKHYARWRKHGDPLFVKGTELGEARDYFECVVLTYEGNECLFWPYKKVEGYGRIFKAGKSRAVHRLACEEENGPPPTPEHHAAHSCGKGHLGCVAKRHLSWKTRKENDDDKVLHGTRSIGENNGNSKICESQAREILSMRGVELQRETASRFGIKMNIVADIQSGRSWRHLSTQPNQ